MDSVFLKQNKCKYVPRGIFKIKRTAIACYAQKKAITLWHDGFFMITNFFFIVSLFPAA